MPEIEGLKKLYDQGNIGIAFLVEWKGVTQADTCKRFLAPAMSDGCFSVDGTFGGISVALHGSNAQTDTNFTALKDIFENLITITEAGKAQVAENPLGYKPILTGGAGTSIDIRLLLYGRR